MKKIIRTTSKAGLLTLLSILILLGAAVPAYAQEVPGGEQAGQIFLILLVLGIPVILGWTSLVLIWRGLFPRRLDWTSSIVRRLSWSSFWFGLIVTLIVLVICAVLFNAGEVLAVLGLIILLMYLLMIVSFGKVAVIEWVGEVVDPSSTGMRRAFLGVVALYVLLFIPFVGWLLVFGIALMGIGAAIYSWLPTREAPAQAVPVVDPPAGIGPVE